MLVAILSSGRVGKTTTDKLLPFATMFVPAKEVAEYKAHIKCDKLVEVPNKIKGVAATKNYIIEKTQEEEIVFAEDNVKSSGYIEFLDDFTKAHKMTGAELYMEFVKLFQVARGMKYRMWSIPESRSAKDWIPQRPLQWHPKLAGGIVGFLRGTGARYDEGFLLHTETEFLLRALVEDGGVVGANYLYWENFHWTDAGGVSQYRTKENEWDCAQQMMVKYPGLVHCSMDGGIKYKLTLKT